MYPTKRKRKMATIAGQKPRKILAHTVRIRMESNSGLPRLFPSKVAIPKGMKMIIPPITVRPRDIGIPRAAIRGARG
ncbi:MAG: hypothetical protein GTO54_03080 [Nitrososphaeria archaeon]|nr:hypothetical protein [Nitrososphaeria archaeon]